jgi:hypothetical protein
MRIVLRVGAKTDDQFYGQVIAFAFLKTILIEFLQLITGSGSIITYIVYGLLLAHLYYGLFKRKRIIVKYLLAWVIIILFFGMNYLLGSRDVRRFYFSTEMLINYFYYLPIAIIVVDSISDTHPIYDSINRYKYIAIGFATIMLFFYSYSSAGQDNYMAFSYAVLPFVLISISDGIREKKLTSYLLFVLGLLEILIYGARMPLVICLVFAVLIYLISIFDKNNTSKWKIARAFLGLFFAVIAFLFGEQILNLISSIASRQGSYSMARFLQGHFFSSSTRDRIYEMGIELIKQSAGRPLWLFADRSNLGVVYVHNIFLEIMIDFGMYAGGAFSIILIWKTIVALVRTAKTGDIYFCLFMVFAVFVRFLVSGSYIIEGMSFVFFALIWKFCEHPVDTNVAHSDVTELRGRYSE